MGTADGNSGANSAHQPPGEKKNKQPRAGFNLPRSSWGLISSEINVLNPGGFVCRVKFYVVYLYMLTSFFFIFFFLFFTFTDV